MQVPKDLPCRVGAGRCHYTTTGMSRRATQVHAANGAAVLSVTGKWPIEQQLVEGEFALEDIALCEPHLSLDFRRRAGFAVEYQVPEIRAVGGDLVNHRLFEPGLVLWGPIPALDFRRGVLDEHGHHMFPGWSHRGVCLGGNQHVQVGVL